MSVELWSVELEYLVVTARIDPRRFPAPTSDSDIGKPRFPATAYSETSSFKLVTWDCVTVNFNALCDSASVTRPERGTSADAVYVN